LKKLKKENKHENSRGEVRAITAKTLMERFVQQKNTIKSIVL